jgi:hypothetical protein
MQQKVSYSAASPLSWSAANDFYSPPAQHSREMVNNISRGNGGRRELVLRSLFSIALGIDEISRVFLGLMEHLKFFIFHR